MSNHETVPALQPTEVSEFFAALAQQGGQLLKCPDIVRKLVAQKSLIGEALSALAPNPALDQWTKFYRDVFGTECNFSGLHIPDRGPDSDFTRLIVVAQGITMQEALVRCYRRFRCDSFSYPNSLDDLVTNCRSNGGGSYAVWVQSTIQAVGANRVGAGKGVRDSACGITLLERLLLELDYFHRTGQHLDMFSWTWCSGSRLNGNDEADLFVRWIEKSTELEIGWLPQDTHHSKLRRREVIV